MNYQHRLWTRRIAAEANRTVWAYVTRVDGAGVAVARYSQMLSPSWMLLDCWQMDVEQILERENHCVWNRMCKQL